MDVALLVLLVFALAVVTVAMAVAAGSGRRRRERQVLPSHYSSLLYADHSRYPGYCTSCGAANEPGYRYCEACGSQIPTTEDYPSGADVRSFLDE